LTETLQRKEPVGRQQYAPILKTAFDFAVPSFGIPKLDALVGRFTTSLCLTGDRIAEALFWSLDRLLDDIVVTRAFTVYQLAALAKDVGQAARRFGANMIAMADMAKMFVTDPLMQKEEGRLAGRIADGLISVSSQIPVMAFASSFSSSDWVSRFDTRIEVLQNQGQFLLSARSGKKRGSVTISERDVYLVKREA
jgi:hypothetical protein